jgi:hypothetical protein
LLLIVQNIKINIIILSYFLKEIAIRASFRFLLDFFNDKNISMDHLEISNIDGINQ